MLNDGFEVTITDPGELRSGGPGRGEAAEAIATGARRAARPGAPVCCSTFRRRPAKIRPKPSFRLFFPVSLENPKNLVFR